MFSITNICKLLLACVLLAKLSAAIPKKYDSQNDGQGQGVNFHKNHLISESSSSTTTTSSSNKDSSSTSTDNIASTVTEYQREMKNNQTIPCMSNCGEWRVLEYPEFIHSKRDNFPRNHQNNQYEQQRRQFNTNSNNNNDKTHNQTNNNLRRHYDTYQDNHFSSDDRYSNQINHQTIQFPYHSYNDSSNTYPDNPWRRSFQKDKFNETGAAYSDNASDRTQRLGYSTGLGASGGYGGYSGGVTNGYGYSGAGVGPYSPYKVDLGGVVLGAIVGIGALIIIPKFIAAFHGGGYGGTGYGSYRNIDELGGVTDMMSKFDEFLSKNNVDSTSCMQKAVCHYIRNSSANANQGSTNQIEDMILALTENSIVDYMIDGTAIKEALTNGRNGDGRDCDAIYSTCPLDRESAIQLMKKFLPFHPK